MPRTKTWLMQGRIKRVKIGNSRFLTLNLDGSMALWDQFPWEDLATVLQITWRPFSP